MVVIVAAIAVTGAFRKQQEIQEEQDREQQSQSPPVDRVVALDWT